MDPLALTDLTPLAPLFADPARALVLHAGDNDLVHLKRRYGLAFAIGVRHRDRRRASSAAARSASTSCSRPTWASRCRPSRQKDDWSERPLSPSQLRYAAADVQHLFALKARLIEELERIGRLAWVEEECAALAAQPAPERPVDPDA